MKVENKKEQVMRETKLLVKLFLKTNASDTELSKMTKISSSTVGRRLTNKEIILMCFPTEGERIFEIIKEKRKYNLQRGKKIGNQSSILNNIEFNNNSPKLRLDVIYSDYNKQMQFLTHLILHFRVQLPLLCELFGFEQNKILDELLKFNEDSKFSIEYLFFTDTYNQELAKENVINYYRDLINAISKKDIATKNVLIREIGDTKIKMFKEQHKYGDIKSDEEILTLLDYQLKYAISSKKLAEKYKFSRVQYMRRVRDITANMPELNMRFEELTSYHKESSLSQWKM